RRDRASFPWRPLYFLLSRAERRERRGNGPGDPFYPPLDSTSQECPTYGAGVAAGLAVPDAGAGAGAGSEASIFWICSGVSLSAASFSVFAAVSFPGARLTACLK